MDEEEKRRERNKFERMTKAVFEDGDAPKGELPLTKRTFCEPVH